MSNRIPESKREDGFEEFNHARPQLVEEMIQDPAVVAASWMIKEEESLKMKDVEIIEIDDESVSTPEDNDTQTERPMEDIQIIENTRKEEKNDSQVFTKGGLRLSGKFRIYFSFQIANGVKTIMVELKDLLREYGDLSCESLLKEARSILVDRKSSYHYGQEIGPLEMNYSNPTGKQLGIEIDRELGYALADCAKEGEITIVVSSIVPASTPEPTKTPHGPAAAVAVTPTKKRPSDNLQTEQRKKTTTTGLSEAEAVAGNSSSAQDASIPSPELARAIVGNLSSTPTEPVSRAVPTVAVAGTLASAQPLLVPRSVAQTAGNLRSSVQAVGSHIGSAKPVPGSSAAASEVASGNLGSTQPHSQPAEAVATNLGSAQQVPASPVVPAKAAGGKRGPAELVHQSVPPAVLPEAAVAGYFEYARPDPVSAEVPVTTVAAKLGSTQHVRESVPVPPAVPPEAAVTRNLGSARAVPVPPPGKRREVTRNHGSRAVMPGEVARNLSSTRPEPVPSAVPSGAGMGTRSSTRPLVVPSTVPSGASAAARNQKSVTLFGVEKRVYLAIAQFYALGVTRPQKMHVALFSGFKSAQTKVFANALIAVRDAGVLEYAPKRAVQLTSFAIQCMPPNLPKPANNREVMRRFMRIIKSHKVEGIYEQLFDGQVHDRVDLAKAIGHTSIDSSGFRESLSTLKKLGFVEYPGKGTVVLTDVAFPYGRPGVAI